MTSARHPTLMLGLGHAGADIAASYVDYVSQDPSLAPLTRALVLTEDGCALADSKEPPLPFESAPESADFAAWFATVASAETMITSRLSDSLRAIGSAESRLKLDQIGVLVDPQTDIILVASLFDSVGSTSLIPILGFLNYLYSGPLLGQSVGVEIVLMWPDLFAESKDAREAYARSAATLKELSRALRLPEDTLGAELAFPTPAVWLLSSTNAEGTNVGSVEDLTPMVVRALAARRAGSISMGSYLAAVEYEEGAAWGSFGLCELAADAGTAMEAVTAGLLAEWGASRSLDPEKKFQRAQVAADVERFMHDSGCATPEAMLTRLAGGGDLFKPLTFTGTADSEKDPATFVSELDAAARKYESSEWLTLQSQLAGRRDAVLSDMETAARTLVATSIDDAGRSFEYAHAFLQSAIDSDSPYLDGEMFENAVTLGTTVSNALAYFEDAMGVTSQRVEYDQVCKEVDAKARLLDERQKQLKSLTAATKKRRKSNKSTTATEQSGVELAVSRVPEAPPSPSQDSAETPCVNAETLAKDIEELGQELTRLRASKKQLQATIRRTSLEAQDKGKRDAARLAKLKDRADERAKIVESLSKAHSTWRQAREDYDVALAKFQTASKGVWISISIAAGLGALLCVALFFLAPLAAIPAFWGWIAVGAAFIGWTVFMLSTLSSAREKVHAAEVKLNDSAGHKRALLNSIYKATVDMFAFRFEWASKTLIVDLVSELRRRLRRMSIEIEEFLTDLSDIAEAAANEWATFEFPVRVFSRPLLSKNGLVSLLERRNMMFPSEVSHLLKEYRYSDAWMDYVSQQDMSDVQLRIANYCKSAYSFLYDVTVDSLVGETPADDPVFGKLLAQAINASQAFLMLYGDGAGSRVAEHAYFGVRGGDNSALFERVKGIADRDFADFSRPQVFDASDPYRATFYRFVLGVDLMNVGLCRFALEQLAKAAPGTLFADPEAANEPLGSAPAVNKDQLWEDLLVSRAIGLCPIDREKKLVYREREHASGPDFEMYLRSFAGRADRKVLHEEAESRLPEAMSQLLSAIQSEQFFDDVELDYLRLRADQIQGW